MKEIWRVNYEWGDLLYEVPAETRLTVYRRLDIVDWLGNVGDRDQYYADSLLALIV